MAPEEGFVPTRLNVGIDDNSTVPKALIYLIFLNIFNRMFISGSRRKRERTTPWVAG